MSQINFHNVSLNRGSSGKKLIRGAKSPTRSDQVKALLKRNSHEPPSYARGIQCWVTAMFQWQRNVPSQSFYGSIQVHIQLEPPENLNLLETTNMNLTLTAVSSVERRLRCRSKIEIRTKEVDGTLREI